MNLNNHKLAKRIIKMLSIDCIKDVYEGVFLWQDTVDNETLEMMETVTKYYPDILVGNFNKFPFEDIVMYSSDKTVKFVHLLLYKSVRDIVDNIKN
ncbi:MAG: hypothetical protein ACRCZ9_08940 [Fusobacteriaceae bacterium]